MNEYIKFGNSHYVLYNSKKSAIFSFRASNVKSVDLPVLRLNGEELKEVDQFIQVLVPHKISSLIEISDPWAAQC